MMDFWSAIVLHVIVTIPPTLAALAALITALRNGRKSDAIHVLVNGERARLLLELEHARAQLVRRD